MCFFFCCRSTLHCEIFSLKQKALVAIANTYTTMKVVDVNKEDQIKSNFYNFNEERSIFVLKEICQNNNFFGRRGGEWVFASPIPVGKGTTNHSTKKQPAYRANSLKTGTHLSLVGSRSSDKIRVILKQEPGSSGCVSCRALKSFFVIAMLIFLALYPLRDMVK